MLTKIRSIYDLPQDPIIAIREIQRFTRMIPTEELRVYSASWIVYCGLGVLNHITLRCLPSDPTVQGFRCLAHPDLDSWSVCVGNPRLDRWVSLHNDMSSPKIKRWKDGGNSVKKRLFK